MDQQKRITNEAAFPAGVVLQLHGLLLGRDADHLAPRPHVHVEEAFEHLFGRHQEARLLGDHAPDMVRQPAVRVRNIRPAFHHEDFGFFVQPAQARRARRAARHSTNNDDFHVMCLLSGYCRPIAARMASSGLTR